MEGCGRVVARVDKHLQSVHKIKPTSVAYKVHLKAAKPYLGVQEMEAMMKKADTESESESESGELESVQSNDSTQMQGSNGQAEDSNLEKAQTPEPDSPANDGKDSKSTSSSSPSSVSESSEEESKVSGSLGTKKYFLATAYFNNHHRWFCEFLRYLALPDAGYKKMATTLQHAGQVSRILEAIDPDGEDIVWTTWVQPQFESASRAPGTILSYLTSIENFTDSYHQKNTMQG